MSATLICGGKNVNDRCAYIEFIYVPVRLCQRGKAVSFRPDLAVARYFGEVIEDSIIAETTDWMGTVPQLASSCQLNYSSISASFRAFMHVRFRFGSLPEP